LVRVGTEGRSSSGRGKGMGATGEEKKRLYLGGKGKERKGGEGNLFLAE